jgi:ParB/RepB/Spo0J family partition protein
MVQVIEPPTIERVLKSEVRGQTSEVSAPISNPPTSTPVFGMVPVDQIFVTKNNFRQEFDEQGEDFQDLVKSIGARGIVEPLLMRAWPKALWPEVLTMVSEDLSQDKRAWRVWRGHLLSTDGPKIDITGRLSQAEANKQCEILKAFDFALIAGERRLRAARIVGLAEVPAMVYSDITDETADELMVLENLQRKDLHDLEYAAGFHRMIKAHGYSVEQLATKANKGKTFIRDLLRLSNLPASAVEAFRAGRIEKSHCILIATIPDEKQRAKYALEVIDIRRDQAVSVREAKEIKEREYMKDLKGAPFALDDKTLDPSWGHACLDCPHYNGNTEESRQGKRPNICLMPTHYAKLVQLFGERRQEEAAILGLPVLPAAQAAKLFYRHHGEQRYKLSYSEDRYVEASGTFMDPGNNYKARAWGPIIKAGAVKTVVAVDPDGEVHVLAIKKEAEAAAKEQGVKFRASGYQKSPTEKKRDAEARAIGVVKREAGIRGLKLASHKLSDFWSPSLNLAPKATAMLRELVRFTLSHTSYDGRKFLATAVGMEMPKRQYGGLNPDPPLKKYLETLNAPELMAFLTQLSMANSVHGWTAGYSSVPDAMRLLKLGGVDLVALQRTVKAEKSAKAKLKKLKGKKKAVKRAAAPDGPRRGSPKQIAQQLAARPKAVKR